MPLSGPSAPAKFPLSCTITGVAVKLVNTRTLVPHPNPVTTYAEALERIAALRAKDTAQVNPVCATEVMTHGQRTKRAVIFLHGFTNCPRQFQSLGQSFFEQGYNVLLPRMPYHGYSDRLTTDYAKLTAEELAAFTDELINIGTGLGEHLTIGGISGGGVASAWAYQFRSEVAQLLLIAPSFGVTYIPKAINSGVTQLARAIPNIFIWWDSKLKLDCKPDYAYPRFATRALAEIMRLGYAVRYAAAETKPAGGRAIVVTVNNDPGVDNAVAAEIAEHWRKQNTPVIEYEFPAELKLVHDLIDPNQPWQRIDVVYPKLIELAETP